MFKYIFATLVLAGLIVGGFQNCSDSEFSSNQGARINPPVVDIPPAAVQSFNVGNFPEGDTCVEAGERKVFMIEVIDGDNEHKIAWKKTDSEEILSSSDSFAFTASPETVGFYEVIVDDGIKNVVYKFSVSYCDEPEPPVQPVDPPQPPIEPVEPPKPVKPPVEEPPPVKPPTEPISCIPPEIKTGQDLSQVLFVGEKFWLGYDVTGDPTPNIKWFFYKVPGDEPKRIYPPQFDHYFDIDPASFEDAGYYYITC